MTDTLREEKKDKETAIIQGKKYYGKMVIYNQMLDKKIGSESINHQRPIHS